MKNANEPAFAAMNETCGQDGISHLEYFAAAALTGLVASNPTVDPSESSERLNAALAKACFNFAEAMCAEAERRRKAIEEHERRRQARPYQPYP